MDENEQPGISMDSNNYESTEDDISAILSESDEENPDETAMTTSDLLNLKTAVNGMMQTEDTDDDDDSEWPDCDSVVVLMAMNQAYSELVSQLIAKVEYVLEQNKKLQKEVLAKQKSLRETDQQVKLKIPLMQYLPPYFKDESGMCPRLNDEAKRKLQVSLFDPLAKDEKKWSTSELKVLRAAVRQATIDSRTQKYRYKKDAIAAKIAAIGVETGDVERQMMNDEMEQMKNKIDYIRQQSDDELLIGDFKDIDWLKISNVDFSASRTPTSLRLKWVNEASPTWGQGPWTKQELAQLKHLREEDFISSSWSVLANRLQTKRSPWQCFEKYKTELEQINKDWTPSEDEKLIALANMLTVNGKIQWEKVTYYMPGRSRQQIRTRYLRTLDKNVKHGRWTDQEDLLLMCAVNRFGAKDWAKVARSVPGRTDIQCRERWVSTLDRRALSADWSLEDDEKIIYAVQIFGREWFRIGQLLNRPIKQVRARYVSLMTAKIKLCAAQEGELRKGIVRIDNAHRSFFNRADVNKIYRTFNALMKGNDPHGDQMLKRIDEKTSSSAKNMWKGVTNEQRQLWEIKSDDITQRHLEKNPVNVSEMLANIQFTERDAERVLRNGFSRRAVANKINKPIRTKYVTVRIDFADDDSEEERIMCMTEALCQAVHSSGQIEWADAFKKGLSKRASELAKHYMVDKLHQDIEQSTACFIEDQPHASISTMAPNATSLSSWDTFQRTRPSLCEIASPAFSHSSVSIADRSDIPPKKKFGPLDKLFIPLRNEIKESEEYLKLKSLMRTVLLEPARLIIACDSDANQAVRDMNHIQLAERVIEMSAYQTEEHSVDARAESTSAINDVQQVAVAECTYIADGGRSTIDFTIDQVVDKICRSSDNGQSAKAQRSRSTKRKPRSARPHNIRTEVSTSPEVSQKLKGTAASDAIIEKQSLDKTIKTEPQSVSRAERATRRSMLHEDDSTTMPLRKRLRTASPKIKLPTPTASSVKKNGRAPRQKNVLEPQEKIVEEENKSAIGQNQTTPGRSGGKRGRPSKQKNELEMEIVEDEDASDAHQVRATSTPSGKKRGRPAKEKKTPEPHAKALGEDSESDAHEIRATPTPTATPSGKKRGRPAKEKKTPEPHAKAFEEDSESDAHEIRATPTPTATPSGKKRGRPAKEKKTPEPHAKAFGEDSESDAHEIRATPTPTATPSGKKRGRPAKEKKTPEPPVKILEEDSESDVHETRATPTATPSGKKRGRPAKPKNALDQLVEILRDDSQSDVHQSQEPTSSITIEPVSVQEDADITEKIEQNQETVDLVCEDVVSSALEDIITSVREDVVSSLDSDQDQETAVSRPMSDLGEVESSFDTEESEPTMGSFPDEPNSVQEDEYGNWVTVTKIKETPASLPIEESSARGDDVDAMETEQSHEAAETNVVSCSAISEDPVTEVKSRAESLDDYESALSIADGDEEEEETDEDSSSRNQPNSAPVVPPGTENNPPLSEDEPQSDLFGDVSD